MFYKTSAFSAEVRSGDAGYSDVADGPVGMTLAVEYSSRKSRGTRCLLCRPVGTAHQGVRTARMIDDKGPARLRLHATTQDLCDIVGDEDRDVGTYW